MAINISLFLKGAKAATQPAPAKPALTSPAPVVPSVVTPPVVTPLAPLQPEAVVPPVVVMQPEASQPAPSQPEASQPEASQPEPVVSPVVVVQPEASQPEPAQPAPVVSAAVAIPSVATLTVTVANLMSKIADGTIGANTQVTLSDVKNGIKKISVTAPSLNQLSSDQLVALNNLLATNKIVAKDGTTAITNIAVTNGNVTLTQNQYQTDLPTLVADLKLGAAKFNIAGVNFFDAAKLIGVTVAGNTSTLAKDASIAQVSIADSSGVINTNMGTLVTLYQQNKLTGLSLTDVATQSPLTLTWAQYATKPTGAIAGSVNNFASDILFALGGAEKASIVLQDTAATLPTNLSKILSEIGSVNASTQARYEITKVQISNGTSLSLSYAQYSALTSTELAVLGNLLDNTGTTLPQMQGSTLAQITNLTLTGITTPAQIVTMIGAIPPALAAHTTIVVNANVNLLATHLTATTASDIYTLLKDATFTAGVLNVTGANMAKLSADDFTVLGQVLSGDAMVGSPKTALGKITVTGAGSAITSAMIDAIEASTLTAAQLDLSTLTSFVSMNRAQYDFLDSNNNNAVRTALAGKINLVGLNTHDAAKLLGITLASNPSTLTKDSNLAAVSVTDTIANINKYGSGSTDPLNQMASLGKLTSVTATSTVAGLNADVTQINGVLSALKNKAKVAGVTLTTSLTVADTAANILGNLVALQAAQTKKQIPSVMLVDTAANISANLDALQAYVKNGLITGITVSDGKTNRVLVTPLQLTSDAAVVGLIPPAQRGTPANAFTPMTPWGVSSAYVDFARDAPLAEWISYNPGGFLRWQSLKNNGNQGLETFNYGGGPFTVQLDGNYNSYSSGLKEFYAKKGGAIQAVVTLNAVGAIPALFGAGQAYSLQVNASFAEIKTDLAKGATSSLLKAGTKLNAVIVQDTGTFSVSADDYVVYGSVLSKMVSSKTSPITNTATPPKTVNMYATPITFTVNDNADAINRLLGDDANLLSVEAGYTKQVVALNVLGLGAQVDATIQFTTIKQVNALAGHVTSAKGVAPRLTADLSRDDFIKDITSAKSALVTNAKYLSAIAVRDEASSAPIAISVGQYSQYLSNMNALATSSKGVLSLGAGTIYSLPVGKGFADAVSYRPGNILNPASTAPYQPPQYAFTLTSADQVSESGLLNYADFSNLPAMPVGVVLSYNIIGKGGEISKSMGAVIEAYQNGSLTGLTLTDASPLVMSWDAYNSVPTGTTGTSHTFAKDILVGIKLQSNAFVGKPSIVLEDTIADIQAFANDPSAASGLDIDNIVAEMNRVNASSEYAISGLKIKDSNSLFFTYKQYMNLQSAAGGGSTVFTKIKSLLGKNIFGQNGAVINNLALKMTADQFLGSMSQFSNLGTGVNVILSDVQTANGLNLLVEELTSLQSGGAITTLQGLLRNGQVLAGDGITGITTISVFDSMINIAKGAEVLQSGLNVVRAIIVQDNTVINLSLDDYAVLADFNSDASAVNNLIVAGAVNNQILQSDGKTPITTFSISGTASDVQGNLDALHDRKLSTLGTILVTDGNPIMVGFTSYQNDQDVIKLLKSGTPPGSSKTLAQPTPPTVLDTTIQEQANIAGLIAAALQNTKTGSAEVAKTVAPKLNKIVTENPFYTTAIVSYIKANYPASFPYFYNALVQINPGIASIINKASSKSGSGYQLIVTDVTIDGLTKTNVGGFAGVINNPNIQSFTVKDTVTRLNGQTSVTITNPITKVSVTYNNTLDLLQHAYKNGNLSSIAVDTSDSNTSMTITGKIYAADSDVVNLIVAGGAYVTIAGMPVAQIASLPTDLSHYTLQISDKASAISTVVDSLQKMAVAGSLESIVVSDGQPVTMTEAQYRNSASFKAMLLAGTPDYKLSLTGVLAGNVPGLLGDTHIKAFYVVDTAANISTYLDQLQSAVVKGFVKGIAINDGKTLSVTKEQYSNDAKALALITGSVPLVTPAPAPPVLPTPAPRNNAPVTAPVPTPTQKTNNLVQASAGLPSSSPPAQGAPVTPNINNLLRNLLSKGK